MMNDIVIDIETKSLEPDALVTAVALAPVPTEHGLCAQECYDLARGRGVMWRVAPYPEGHVDPETVAWWNEQPEVVRKIVHGDETSTRLHIDRVLDNMTGFIGGNECLTWCSGTDFDTLILRRVAQRREVPLPAWLEFYNCRDIRTLRKTMVGVADRPCGLRDVVKHHPLHDAALDAVVVYRVRAFLARMNGK